MEDLKKKIYSEVFKEFLIEKIENKFNKTSDFAKAIEPSLNGNYAYRLYQKDFVFSPTLYALFPIANAFGQTASELIYEFEETYLKKISLNIERMGLTNKENDLG